MRKLVAHSEFNIEDFKKSFLKQASAEGLGNKIKIINIQEHKRNANTVTYVLETTIGTFHVKIPNPENFTNRIYPEIALHGLLVAERMSRREGQPHSPFCSFVQSGKDTWSVPKIPEESVVCQISWYAPGRSFLEVVHGKGGVNAAITSEKERHLRTVITELKKIHAMRYYPEAFNHSGKRKAHLISTYWEDIATAAFSPKKKAEILDEVSLVSSIYNTYLETIIQKRVHQLSFDKPHPIVTREIETELYQNTLRIASVFSNRFDRLRRAHGDFWWMNASLTTQGWILIDHSKFPWADSALDVAWWCEEYRWKYYQTGNNVWKDWYKLFIEIYQENEPDSELQTAMCPGISLKSLVKLNPKYSGKWNPDGAQKYLNNIRAILQESQAHWTE